MNDEFTPQQIPSTMFHSLANLPALFEAFAQAQAEYLPVIRDRLVVQKLKDKQTGSYTGREIKFLYADLAAILAATRPALSKHGLAFMQPIETADDGTAWVVSVLAHKLGGMVTSRMMIAPAKDQKEFGGNVTYARRFAAGPLLSVSAEDDAEENGEGVDRDGDDWPPAQPERSARPTPARKSAPSKPASADAMAGTINAGQVKFLQNKLKALKLTDAAAQEFYERMQVDGFTEEITLEKFAQLTHELDRMRDA